jgi:hypothetical protein
LQGLWWSRARRKRRLDGEAERACVAEERGGGAEGPRGDAELGLGLCAQEIPFVGWRGYPGVRARGEQLAGGFGGGRCAPGREGERGRRS